ncbi:hypothetical protein SASPL_123513 [Salvia splendens]|uniref:Uncharacterized protein n=1 Tax=Salvia splendens TaxID=180675 RepID=A0A8X8XNC4_SALSN|nr:hypothetical protein SASPL_123513 [Salvia splendens]
MLLVASLPLVYRGQKLRLEPYDSEGGGYGARDSPKALPLDDKVANGGARHIDFANTSGNCYDRVVVWHRDSAYDESSESVTNTEVNSTPETTSSNSVSLEKRNKICKPRDRLRNILLKSEEELVREDHSELACEGAFVKSKKTIRKIKVQVFIHGEAGNISAKVINLPDGFGDDMIIEVQDSQGKYCGHALVHVADTSDESVRFLGEVSFQIEQILTLVFENYKSLDESSPSGIKDVFGPATGVAAPALDPALKLYKMLHDILSPEIATRKRNSLANLGLWSQSRHKDSCSVVLLDKTDGGVDEEELMREDHSELAAEGAFVKSKKAIGKIKVQVLKAKRGWSGTHWLHVYIFKVFIHGEAGNISAKVINLPDGFGFGDDLIIEVQDSQGKYCGLVLVQVPDTSDQSVLDLDLMGRSIVSVLYPGNQSTKKLEKIQLYTNYSTTAYENSYKCTSVAAETIAYDNAFGDCDERPIVSAKKLVVATWFVEIGG